MRTLTIASFLAITSLAFPNWAEPQGNVIQQVQSAYVPTLMDSSGIKVAQKGTILAVQIDGIMAAQKKGLSGPYYNAFASGQIGPDGGLKATALNHRAINPRALAIGEKVYLLKADVGSNSITFSVQSCGTCDPKAVDPGHEPYRAEVTFKFVKGALAGTDFNQVKGVIEQVFKVPDDAPASDAAPPQTAARPRAAGAPPAPAEPAPQAEQPPAAPAEAAKYADIPPPPAPPAAPRKLAKGMTPDEVKAILGEPESMVDLGGKVIYKYKDYKFTFVGGKVSDIEVL
jgi:hypothetical protein